MAGNQIEDAWSHSLAVQVRYLSQNLETHLLGNHLFANAKALVFAGLFFEGEEAGQWLQTGLELIHRELPEQVLSDGGNFELSTMYHAIFLEDMLDLLNMAQSYCPDCLEGVEGTELLKVNSLRLCDEFISDWKEVSSQMVEWLFGMTHPDGEIGLFNDAAFGIASTPDELINYAERVGVDINSRSAEDEETPNAISRRTLRLPSDITYGYTHFSDSGYIRLESHSAVALLDVTRVGPDYLPGHAHADTLSFELSLFGQRTIVNGGTSQYGTDEIRQYERGTGAHSTVQIGTHNSSEVWGGFRVARRAYPVGLSVEQENNSVTVRCGHNGYHRLEGMPNHWRLWQFAANRLMIEDTINGKTEPAIARYILHPDVAPMLDQGRCVVQLPLGQLVTMTVLKGEVTLQDSLYAPEFGLRIPTKVLTVKLDEGESQVMIEWTNP